MLQAIQAWDESVLLWFQAYARTDVGNVIMTTWSRLGDSGLIFIAISLLMLFFAKTRRAGTLSLCSMLLGLGVTNGVVKHLVARARPWVVMQDWAPLLYSSDPNSFPSGHTSAAFAFAVALCLNLKSRWGRALALAAAVLMGLSRVYVGVHFPTDVLAGAALGTIYAVVCTAVYRKFFRERFPLEGKQPKLS